MSTNKPKYKPIKLGSPGEEISKKDLHAVSQRFKNLHQFRLQRIQEYLSPRQQNFLDLLPLIFHLNHPLLPGFITSETPAGIPDYAANRKSIRAAKHFSKTFSYKRRALIDYSIYGIFLMGSVSSIAFSKTSDMDIWLCHQPELSTEELEELQSKATDVEKWAHSLDLEVHFFLVDSGEFMRGKDTPISTESSGATQHYLLLEEFYRTAIFIAGRIPVWWIVPPHEEKNYTNYVQHLKQKRFISANEIIDFGGFESVPPEEFISATLWHLYKSINSPYKSILKLMIMECYASEFPNPNWLCLDLKQSIYQGTFNIDYLDPYVQIYQKIEGYLKPAEDSDRLHLARQCFYLKIMGSERYVPDSPLKKQRELFLQNMAKKSAWPEATFSKFNDRRNWNILNAEREHITIINELNLCHRMISGFAGEHIQKNYQEHDDIKLIGRKLYSFLEKKPGKIEVITTRSTIHNKEKELSILEIPFAAGDLGWSLFLGNVKLYEQQKSQPIKKSWSLIEILSWLVINDFYDKKALIHFESSTHNISSSEIHKIVSDLRLFLNKRMDEASKTLDTYKQANNFTASLMFINLGLTLQEERGDGMLVISDRSDILSYGANRQNFVHSIDRISLSSWGEVITNQYRGIEGLFNCLAELINNHKPLTPSSLEISCYTPMRAASIIMRIKNIFATLVRLFSDTSNQQSPRYILPGKHSYYVFQRQENRLTFKVLDDDKALQDELASPQRLYSPVHMDDEVMKYSTPTFIFPFNLPQVIQVFFEAKDSSVDIFILDEKGSLFYQSHENAIPNNLLTAHSEFLETLINRGMLEHAKAIEYYEIYKNSKGFPGCNRIELKAAPIRQYFDLRITGKELSSGQVIYTIYCNGMEFSTMEHGNHVFKSTAEYIYLHRQNHHHYPIHITDIDVPLSVLGITATEEKQSTHFLQHKKKIEERLNDL